MKNNFPQSNSHRFKNADGVNQSLQSQTLSHFFENVLSAFRDNVLSEARASVRQKLSLSCFFTPYYITKH